MVREDLIEGAVTFLQDPSVSSAPVEQRVAFLRSKNLTQEEIDASLARVGQATPSQAASTTSYSAQQQQQYRQPSQQQYGGYQQQYPYQWQQPPPEVPRRDWRDWFIMATVMGGVGYGLYWTAKRYVYPIIAPPTPPQLEQDKAKIDESFDKAFALLDQLATDTAELKDSEKARTERLDAALAEVESVLGKMKAANEERELEAKRMSREMSEIKDQIPRAIEKERSGIDGRLQDLGGEMKSLKTLVANRMQQPQQRMTPSFSSQSSSVSQVNGTSVASSAAPATTPTPTGGNAAGVESVNGMGASSNSVDGEAEKPASVLPERSGSASQYGRTLGGKAAIPSWQLAAKKRSEDAKKAAESTTASGTSTPTGQDISSSGTVEEASA